MSEYDVIISTFPKSSRLRKRTDFLSLLKSSKKIHVKGFLIVWHNNSYSGSRLGITVSKKNGCAVIRNRVKRLCREVYRHHRLLLPSVDINIIARRESVLMDYDSIQRELISAFTHIGAFSCSRVSCSA